VSSYVISFQDIDRAKVAVVGGKGANLGEISKLEGIHVGRDCPESEKVGAVPGATHPYLGIKRRVKTSEKAGSR
jgi:hypothetical protein